VPSALKRDSVTIEEVREAFDEAEDWLKKHEFQTSQGPLIPAINELRYAGFHVLRSEHEKATRRFQIVVGLALTGISLALFLKFLF